MKYKILLTVALLFAPVISFGQVGPASDVQTLVLYLLTFFNFILMPLLFSVALLFFILNVVRYFFVEVNNYDGKEKAKRFALYSIAAFVFAVSLWGIVNLFVGALGFDRSEYLCPDYLGRFGCGPAEFDPRYSDYERGLIP